MTTAHRTILNHSQCLHPQHRQMIPFSKPLVTINKPSEKTVSSGFSLSRQHSLSLITQRPVNTFINFWSICALARQNRQPVLPGQKSHRVNLVPIAIGIFVTPKRTRRIRAMPKSKINTLTLAVVCISLRRLL